MYFAGKMKLNIRVIRPFRIQEPLALGQVHHMAILVFRNIRLLEPGKIQ